MSTEVTAEKPTKKVVKKVVKKQPSTESNDQSPSPEPTVEKSSEPVLTQVDADSSATELVSGDALDESSVEVLFKKLINQFADMQSVMKTFHSNMKVLQKEVLKEQKEVKKIVDKKKKKANGKKKAPSGFAKASSVTDELAIFLGLDAGTLIARTDVTAKVIAYVKSQNLQNPEKKKEIVPDAKLAALLTPEEGDIVTFFNLQRYLKRHFLPTVSAEPSTVV
jgi:chromatin remodeling complex protein RSC6